MKWNPSGRRQSYNHSRSSAISRCREAEFTFHTCCFLYSSSFIPSQFSHLTHYS